MVVSAEVAAAHPRLQVMKGGGQGNLAVFHKAKVYCVCCPLWVCKNCLSRSMGCDVQSSC